MDIKEIATKIHNMGGNLYLVGGAVRDKAMGIKPKDFDYCITGISVETFLNEFPEAKSKGKSFEVFYIEDSEFAFARKEKKISDGHKGFEIETDENISIEDDLLRRDVTINSIAIDVLTDAIIDPYGGIKDINEKVLRATSNAFLEDPLRTYRVARFASELDFRLDNETLKLMKRTKEDLYNLSSERIVNELTRALKAKKPSNFFRVLKDADCLDIHFIEIYNLIGKTQPVVYHPEGDAFEHTMKVVDEVSKHTDKDYIIFAGLVHDLGKGTTPMEELPHHIEHDKKGIELVRNMAVRLGLTKKYLEAGITATKEHMKAGLFYNMKATTKVDFLVRNYKSVLGLEGLEIIANADKCCSDKKIHFSEIGNKMIKEVNAKELEKELDYEKLVIKLRDNRIKWLKENLHEVNE